MLIGSMLAGTGRGTFAMEVRFFLSHSVVKGERREIATCALFCTGRGSVLDLNLRFAGVDKVSPPPIQQNFRSHSVRKRMISDRIRFTD